MCFKLCVITHEWNEYPRISQRACGCHFRRRWSQHRCCQPRCPLESRKENLVLQTCEARMHQSLSVEVRARVFRVELAHTVGFGRWFSTFFYWMWPVLDFNSIFLTMKGMQGMDWLSLNCACSNAVQMLDYTSVLKMKKIGRHAQEQWCHFKQRPFGVPPER